MQRTSTHYFEGVQWVSKKHAVWPFLARVLTQLGPPILCFVLARSMLHAAALATGNDPSDANAWSRWDSEQYVSIAHKGYELSKCEGIEGYEPDDWCGNDAWLPGYAFLIRLVVQLGHGSFNEAGVMISAGFTLASLLVLWVLFLRAKLSVNNVLVLLLAAFFPGHVYDHAVFPVAQFVFFLMLSLWLYSKRRFAFSGLCALAAAFSYSSGLFLCGAFCLFVLMFERERLFRKPLVELAWPCGGVLLGFSAALALQWSQTGVWNAFFRVQQKYAYSPRLPFELWASNFAHLFRNWPRNGGPNEQTLLVAGLCVLMLVYTFKERVATRLEMLLAAFALVYWLVPIALGGQLSLHRAEATLLPAVPLARRIPWPILGFVVYLAIQLSWLMGRKFFRGTIV
jgi:hypothetical protein